MDLADISAKKYEKPLKETKNILKHGLLNEVKSESACCINFPTNSFIQLNKTMSSSLPSPINTENQITGGKNLHKFILSKTVNSFGSG